MKMAQRASSALVLAAGLALMSGPVFAAGFKLYDLSPGMRRTQVLASRGQAPSVRGEAGGQPYLGFDETLAGEEVLLLCFFEEDRLERAVWAVKRSLDRAEGQRVYEALKAELSRRVGRPAAERFWTPYDPERRILDGGMAKRPGPFSLFCVWRRPGAEIMVFVRGEGEAVEAGVEMTAPGKASGRGQQ